MVSAEYVTVKLTFDLSDIKSDEVVFIIMLIATLTFDHQNVISSFLFC